MLADCADRLVQIFAKKRADDLRMLFNRAFLPLGHDLIQPARALHGAEPILIDLVEERLSFARSLGVCRTRSSAWRITRKISLSVSAEAT